MAKSRHSASLSTHVHAASRGISRSDLDALFRRVGQQLREGHSSEAEKTLERTLENYALSAETVADLKRLLSFTLETAGRYKEALAVIEAFADEANLEGLKLETRLRVVTQLA